MLLSICGWKMRIQISYACLLDVISDTTISDQSRHMGNATPIRTTRCDMAVIP